MPDLKFFTKGEVCAASQGRMDGEWQSDGTGLQPFCDMRDNTWGVAPGWYRLGRWPTIFAMPQVVSSPVICVGAGKKDRRSVGSPL